MAEELLSAVERERLIILGYRETLKKNNSDALQWDIQMALNDLDDAEHQLKSSGPLWEIVNTAMESAQAHRNAIADAVLRYGYKVEEIFPKK
jgi:hypothetical protein